MSVDSNVNTKPEKAEETEVNTKAETQAETEEEDDKMVFKLAKPYKFEGDTYTKVDLRGLDNLKAADMIAVNRELSRSGNMDFLQEMTLEYACAIAAKGTDKPIEFYKGLPPKDSIKLKSRVTGFLYGAE